MDDFNQKSEQRNILVLIISIAQVFLVIIVIISYVVALFSGKEISNGFEKVSFAILGNFFGYTSAMISFYFKN